MKSQKLRSIPGLIIKPGFPPSNLPASCAAVNSIEPLKYLAEKAGYNVLNLEETAILELKNIEYQRSILEAKEKYIKET